MMVEDIKKDFNNSLKEIQENTAKQVEDLKEETQKSLKELQENTTKHVLELNKNIQGWSFLLIRSATPTAGTCGATHVHLSTGPEIIRRESGPLPLPS